MKITADPTEMPKFKLQPPIKARYKPLNEDCSITLFDPYTRYWPTKPRYLIQTKIGKVFFQFAILRDDFNRDFEVDKSRISDDGRPEAGLFLGFNNTLFSKPRNKCLNYEKIVFN